MLMLAVVNSTYCILGRENNTHYVFESSVEKYLAVFLFVLIIKSSYVKTESYSPTNNQTKILMLRK